MSYYKEVRQLKIISIPVTLKLQYWNALACYLLPITQQEDEDTHGVQCWRAVLVQIVMTIASKQVIGQANSYKNPNKERKINFTPAEKYALEQLLYNEQLDNLYLSIIFQDIINQFDAFDTNNGNAPIRI